MEIFDKLPNENIYRPGKKYYDTDKTEVNHNSEFGSTECG